MSRSRLAGRGSIAMGRGPITWRVRGQQPTACWTIAGHGTGFSLSLFLSHFKFGLGVPQTAIAATTKSQKGSTPTPGIASITNPGRSSYCQPSTENSRAAVTTSTAHMAGGAKVKKPPMTSDIAAMANARASCFFEKPRGKRDALAGPYRCSSGRPDEAPPVGVFGGRPGFMAFPSAQV